MFLSPVFIYRALARWFGFYLSGFEGSCAISGKMRRKRLFRQIPRCFPRLRLFRSARYGSCRAGEDRRRRAIDRDSR